MSYNKHTVPIEMAKVLKQVDFDEPCKYFYILYKADVWKRSDAESYLLDQLGNDSLDEQLEKYDVDMLDYKNLMYAIKNRDISLSDEIDPEGLYNWNDQEDIVSKAQYYNNKNLYKEYLSQRIALKHPGAALRDFLELDQKLSLKALSWYLYTSKEEIAASVLENRRERVKSWRSVSEMIADSLPISDYKLMIYRDIISAPGYLSVWKWLEKNFGVTIELSYYRIKGWVARCKAFAIETSNIDKYVCLKNTLNLIIDKLLIKKLCT